MPVSAIDYDPFADAAPAQAGGTITQVDHDPFADAGPGAWDAAKDIAQSGLTGLGKGIAHIPSLIGDARDLLSNLSQGLAAYGLEHTGQLPPGKTAADLLADVNKPVPPVDANADPSLLGRVARAADSFAMPNSAQIDRVVQGVTGPYHQPQTEAGLYADAVGQFLPLAAAGGSPLRFGVIPGVASEAAGQATAGTPYEGAARAIAPVLAGGAASFATGPSVEQSMLANATRGVDPQTMQAAQQIMESAAQRGIRLTSAEAIQQPSGGATQMGRVQRLVEGTREGGEIMAPAMAARPGQVAGAVNDTLDRIAPATTQPSVLGMQGQEAAGNAIEGVNGQINQASRPYYQAAETQQIDPHDFAPIATNPAFQASLNRLRANPVLAPQYAHLPDNSIGVIDAVTKDMRARGQALSNAANPGFQPQEAATYGGGARDARDIARDPARGGSGDYDAALQLQRAGRQQFLDPLQAGPLGTMSQTPAVRAQTAALFPSAPLEGAADETSQAIGHLNQQNPAIASALARQHLATAFSEASQNNIPGDNQWGGAKFAAQIAGNPLQRETLNAGLTALPNGAAVAPDVHDLLTALEATGKRQAPGSLTAFNAEDLKNLSEPGSAAALGQALMTLSPGAIWGKASDALTRARLGSRSSALANALLANPEEAFAAIGAAQRAAPVGRAERDLAAALLAGRTGSISQSRP
ncbi:hypothetical protein [Methylocapsa palsarum]|uniref:Uncharacterized protein n=1 Tax=Methylocapsa palsarum TaxID=1612308 RepID=A0A1I4CFF7_9HYPH|nr:hypothetical protein [Methylocapsa palsarum]SFK79027.1 hypothetical protein SAMN05444581_12111 [Methylocapsa palsarum]